MTSQPPWCSSTVYGRPVAAPSACRSSRSKVRKWPQAGVGSSSNGTATTARRRATRSADTVFAVHLLEHLPRGLDAEVLAEMLRVARRRAVVAVPFEDEPTPAWGHVRTFDLDDLHALGASTGLPYTVDEHHGGWLVIDP